MSESDTPIRIIWQSRFVRAILSLIFLTSAVGKAFELMTFEATINKFAILPSDTSFITAVSLVLTELAIGLSIMLNLRGALFVAAGLVAFFSVVLIYGLWAELEIRCNCFGAGPSSGLEAALAKNAILLGLIFFLLVWRREFTLPASSLSSMTQTLKQLLAR